MSVSASEKTRRDTGNLCKSQQQQFSARFHFGCTFQGFRNQLYFKYDKFWVLYSGWIMREGRKNKSRGTEVMEGGLSKKEGDSEGEKRSSCDLRRRPCNLPRYLTGCFMSVAESEKGGRLIIQLTEVFLWWMSRGAAGREGGREGVIKLSASLLEWSCSDWERGGRKEKERESEGKAGEVLQILACKWAQVHVCAPYVHVCVCVCVTWGRQFARSCCWRQCAEWSLSLFGMRGTSPP